jgi:hypothetical protein
MAPLEAMWGFQSSQEAESQAEVPPQKSHGHRDFSATFYLTAFK